MKPKYTFLEFHIECERTGKMPTMGLCGACDTWLIPKLPEELLPTEDDKNQLAKDEMPTVFWGRGSFDNNYQVYTSLRATIICFAHELTKKK